MGLLNTILELVGVNDKAGQELKGVLQWIEQQGGIHAIVDHLQAGEFSDIVKSWLADENNMAISSDIVKKMFSAEAVQQLASNVGVNSEDAASLLAKYLPQLVDKISSAGAIAKDADLASVISGSLR
ncbi:YidB family protein [Pantoea sp. RRHST58]|uniref:YidB family protein n=1 Tax=Pantoea sp. RRHST58 TaxID=3425183 RepID=UPI003D9FB9BD